MTTLYIIGHGDSRAQGLGGTYDRLGSGQAASLGVGYTVVPTVALTGGDGTGGHYTASLLAGGGITIYPDLTGTGYVNIANYPTVTISGGGSPTTPAVFSATYAGGYFTQIERQLIAAGYTVKFINIAHGSALIGDIVPGSGWVSESGVALVNRLGAANCLFYFSVGLNDATSSAPITTGGWAASAAALLSGYTALGVKVLANRACDIVSTTVANMTGGQIAAANALVTQYNASLDTLQANNPTTFKIITDEQTLMHGHPEWFGANTSNLNDAGNLVIANDAVPKLKTYLSASFPAASPAPVSPASLTATASQASVTLTWPAAVTATNYRVRKDGVTTPVYDGPLLTFTDMFTLGTGHTYTVSAYNSTGESPQTAAIVATALTASLSLTVTAGAGVNTLAWLSDPQAANGYAVLWMPGSALPVVGATGEVVARVTQGTLTWADTSAYRIGMTAGSRYEIISLH